MDQKIAQYLNKDTSNVLEKCFENLYDSLEKDITLMCASFDKERSDKSLEPIKVSEKTLKDEENKENKENIKDTKNNKCELEKIRKRVELAMKTISELNILDQGGTSYLGSGAAFDKKMMN